MDDTLAKIGRILFAIPFAVFGMMHFMNASMMAGMVPIPGGVIWVYLTGACLIAAAIAILIGKYARLACQLLGLFLMLTALTVHLPGILSAPDMGAAAPSMSNMLKDVSLAGGAWAISTLFAKDANPIG